MVERCGRGVTLARSLAVPVDASAQLVAGAGGDGVVIDPKAWPVDVRGNRLAYQL